MFVTGWGNVQKGRFRTDFSHFGQYLCKLPGFYTYFSTGSLDCRAHGASRARKCPVLRTIMTICPFRAQKPPFLWTKPAETPSRPRRKPFLRTKPKQSSNIALAANASRGGNGCICTLLKCTWILASGRVLLYTALRNKSKGGKFKSSVPIIRPVSRYVCTLEQRTSTGLFR